MGKEDTSMGVWKNTPEGKTVRRNKIAEQFAWHGISMLESPAYRALSLSGHRILARINIEHAHHGGQDNGQLPVTFQDLEDYGVHRHAIAPGIREVEALGFIRITQQGRAGNADWRKPNKFALTHLPTKDNPKPTEDWKRIKTIEEAEMLAHTARNAVPKKQKTSAGKRHFGAENAPQTLIFHPLKPHYGRRQKPHHYLYLGRELELEPPLSLSSP
jgi:hypothetical protein